MGMPGTTELIVILVILVILFGHKRVPQLMTGLGDALVGLKRGLREAEEIDDAARDGTRKEYA